MGRRREEFDPDRFLHVRDGRFHYRRRVPKEALDLDERAPLIRFSLNTSDRQKARAARDLHEAADNALWASLLLGDNPQAARARYKLAVKRAESLGFVYRPLAEIIANDPDDTFLQRFEAVADQAAGSPIVAALDGTVQRPDDNVTEALQFYFSDIARDELRTKSPDQKKRWKEKREYSVRVFVDLCGDLTMQEIGRDHALKVHKHWLDRVAPQQGAPTCSPSTGNRNMGNLRTLYRDYFKHLGFADRKNPFDSLSFKDKKKRSRPPFPHEWITDKILKVGALDNLNDQARGILLMVAAIGARPSEIANLRPDMIHLDAEIPYISIEPCDDPEEPREIKTESSVRLMPLTGLAFAVMKKHPNGFPKYRDRGASLSALVNKYLRNHKLLPTPRHTAYSLRHSFEDRMKNARLDEELRRIFMGHTIDRPKYGEGGAMQMWLEEIKKVDLPFDPVIVETVGERRRVSRPQPGS
ncbi:MAG: DUF6538 domain-containing protein [Mesorhizobium sp.]